MVEGMINVFTEKEDRDYTGWSWIQAVVALRRRKRHFPMGTCSLPSSKSRGLVLALQRSFLEMKWLYNQTLRAQQGSGPCSQADLP